MTNPFAAIAADLGRTVARAKPLLMKLNNVDTSTRPSATKWAKKEILGHLMDSASNNQQRFVRAALQGSLTFPGYDQEPLVELQNFREVDWSFLVDLWASYNRFSRTCSPGFRPLPPGLRATSATIRRPRSAGSLKITWPT